MTSTQEVKMECLCGIVNKITYVSSINTWLNPELISELIDERLNSFVCKGCNKKFTIPGDILVNCNKGVILINPTEDHEAIMDALEEYRIINRDGTIRDEFFERFKQHRPKN